MEEIKSKKKKRRIAKGKTKKTLVYQWVVDFHTLFGYYPTPQLQDFIETHILSGEERGRQAGIIEEAKGHEDLVKAIMVWHALWMQDPKENDKTEISALDLINWKLKKTFADGKLSVDNPNASAPSLSIPKESEMLQADTDGRSDPSGENSETISGRRGDGETDNEETTGQAKVEEPVES